MGAKTDNFPYFLQIEPMWSHLAIKITYFGSRRGSLSLDESENPVALLASGITNTSFLIELRLPEVSSLLDTVTTAHVQIPVTTDSTIEATLCDS